MYPQRVGRQKHVLDIDIHFNDGPRGGLNRRRGRPRTQRTWNGPNNGAPADGSNGNATADTEQSGGYTPNNSGPTGNTDRRRNNQQSYRNRNDRGPRRDFYVNDSFILIYCFCDIFPSVIVRIYFSLHSTANHPSERKKKKKSKTNTRC